LPRLGAAKPASNVNESLASADVVIPRAESAPREAPAPQPQAETYTAPPREEQIIAKKIPKLDEQKTEPRKESAPSGGEYVTPKPLPRLNAPKKKAEESPPP